jgi:ABC-type enterochelin transport system substrate-binding protein
LGFEWPNEQSVWLQLLEHNNESVVTEAIKKLTSLFDEQEEVPERQAVLDSRLRRIAEYADEPSTQEAASELQRRLAAHKASNV